MQISLEITRRSVRRAEPVVAEGKAVAGNWVVMLGFRDSMLPVKMK